MRGLLELYAGWARYILAVGIGVVPRRWWARLEPPLPMCAAAFISGAVTATAGVALSIGGFFHYAERVTSERNATLLRLVAEGRSAEADQFALAAYTLSSVVLFEFLFFTPLGLLAIYLTVSGWVRLVSAWFDDPRGDFLLSGVDWAATTLFRKNRLEREHLARERREGPEVPDRLFAGDWAGVEADYVVVASRRKAEWNPGAIILTSSDWYRLGVPFDIDTPAGARTAYPLKKMDTVEVVRRGIQYELPRLASGRPMSSAPERGKRR